MRDPTYSGIDQARYGGMDLRLTILILKVAGPKTDKFVVKGSFAGAKRSNEADLTEGRRKRKSRT